eukprot:3672557-Pyramimonas_sp.AAC.1
MSAQGASEPAAEGPERGPAAPPARSPRRGPRPRWRRLPPQAAGRPRSAPARSCSAWRSPSRRTRWP